MAESFETIRVSAAGFARRPAGGGDLELAGELQDARDRLAQLRPRLGRLQTASKRQRGAGLVELDIGRALAALGTADLALARAHRHANLEEPA